MQDWKSELDLERIPKHIAIIMDGNGRWAKKRGGVRLLGHRSGAKSVKNITEGCVEVGVKYLTLYAFSTENWNRPNDEVNGLMELLVENLEKEYQTLVKNGVRLNAIGDLSMLPADVRRRLLETIEKTASGDKMTLNLALSYSGKWDILNATKNISEDIKAGKLSTDQIDDKLFKSYLSTSGQPDPELMIRTSGEFRLSNYLLYQLAYAEFYFTNVFWPDFNKVELAKALYDYQTRERRFGKTSEQL